MAAGLHQRPSLQGLARPAYRSGTHYRDRLRVVSLPQNNGEETQKVTPEASVRSPSASPSGLRSSRTEHPPNHQRPRGWAKTNRRSGPNQVAKRTGGGLNALPEGPFIV